MNRIGKIHLVGSLAGIVVLGTAVAGPAVAQQAGSIERAVNATSASNPSKRKSAQAAKRGAGTEHNVARSVNVDAWTIRQALPDNSKAVRSEPTPAASGSQFGRLQLDTGSVGISTETQLKEGRFADGRQVPGLEIEKRNTPSYFGLSLSVPTSGDTLIPAPLLPRRE